MKHLLTVMAVAIGGLIALVSLASAEVPSAGSAVFEIVRPYLVEVASVFVAAIVGWLATTIKAKLGIDIEARHREALQAALTNAAGLVINRAGGAASALKLPVQSPAIAEGLTYVIKNAPDALAYFGITPDGAAAALAEKLEAKIGVIAASKA